MESRMAWNEPGNGKQRDPWKSSGGDQPPDLDEVFRNVQRRLKRMFGGGGGSSSPGSGAGAGTGFGLLIGALLALWLVVDSVYIIDEPERGVVLRFGEYTRTMEPGLNMTLPRPFDRVYRVDVTQIRSETTQGSMLTQDENIIAVSLAVQFRVKDAFEFLFKVDDPISTMEQGAESAMRQVIGDNPMDFVLLEGRAEIAVLIHDLLQEIVDKYQTGLEITAVNLQEIRPPREVKEAFDDAIKAREDKERYENQAEAQANRIVPEARGQAGRILQEAEGYRAAVMAKAEGESRRFSLLRAEFEKAPGVTRQRLYLETLESVMQNSSKVLVDIEQGNNVMYLPLDQLIQSTVPAIQQRQESANAADTRREDNLRSGRTNSRSGREDR
jgi:membrane protease subunit HflK